MTKSLKHKAVVGVLWNLMERFSLQGIKLSITVVLARLLTPEDFGLIALVSVLFVIANSIIESGFGQAYIQKKQVSRIDSNTIFFTNFGISLIFYVIFWFSAPLISKFYNEPQLILLTRVLAIVLIINSFKIIQTAQLVRSINFKHLAKANLVSAPLSGMLGILAAYYGMGVWSLVIQELSNSIFLLVSFWVISKWKPQFEFSVKSLKEMFSFGGWLLLSGIISRILNNIYVLIIGKLFPAGQLGLYSKGKSFSILLTQELSKVITTVTFPVFSQMQDDKKRMANNMIKTLKIILFITVFVMVALMVVAKPFVLLLLTDKWAPMIQYLQLFCIVGIIFPINQINMQILKAQGKSRLLFNIGLLKGGISLLNIIIMYRWGILFIIIGQVLGSFIALAINTFYTKRLLNAGLFWQLNEIKEIILGGIFSGGAAYYLTHSIANLWIQLFLGGTLTVLFFFGSQVMLNRKLLVELYKLKSFIK